jgi:pyruvate formate lyase activating enzyme
MILKSNSNDIVENGATGVVFKIQRYSIQDGPGIRTTVFLKGCPLACQWCSNPESQNPNPEILIRKQFCQACGECVRACKKGAASIVNGAVDIDRSLCDACNVCIDVCPSGTLEKIGEIMPLEDVLNECCRDELFYKNSGGGVTLSGGEPLFQPEFSFQLMKRCKDRALATALDTCGYAPWEVMQDILQYTDLVLFDLKHINPEAHLLGTRVKNDVILSNLKKTLTETRARVWIRIPLIPGYNDAADHIACLALTLQGLPVEKISLLTYHEWGKPKYDFLGREYPLASIEASDEKKAESAKSFLESRGFCVTIGH